MSKHDEYATDDLPKVLVPIANGTEELEAVTIIDTLVRGGCAVVVASVEETLQVKCSRGVKLVADKLIKDCLEDEFALVVCPGGMPGATHLRDSSALTTILQKQKTAGKLYGAICAAPAIVLAPQGLLDGKVATCYPSAKLQGELPQLSEDIVVVSDNVITSKGPGTAIAFSLKLIELLFDEAKASRVAKEMIVV